MFQKASEDEKERRRKEEDPIMKRFVKHNRDVMEDQIIDKVFRKIQSEYSAAVAKKPGTNVLIEDS